MCKKCKFCNKEISEEKTFCNFNCYKLFKQREKEIRDKDCLRHCNNCGKEIITQYRNIKRNKNFYCSLECMFEYKKKMDLRETKVNDNYFDVLSPAVCWMLGILASDGNISNNKFFEISQSGDEGLECIQYIKKELNYTGNIYTYKPKRGRMVYSIKINSKYAVNKLKEYNIVNNKTKIFTIPEIILKNEEYLRYFLWGYIDGDGCVGIYPKNTNNSKNILIEFVCNNIMKEQIINVEKIKYSGILNKGSVFEFTFRGVKGIEFGKWLYNDTENIIYKSYKYKKFIDYIDNMFKYTKNLKYIPIKNKFIIDITNNPDINCMKYAEKINIPFQTVYYWRKLWKQGKLQIDQRTEILGH